MFHLIGQKPAAGRDFSPADETRGAPAVAILTYGLWERRYGRDPAVIGRTIRINSTPATVIGVMPKDFVFPFNQDLWMPLVPTDDFEKRESRFMVVIGRLAEGSTISCVDRRSPVFGNAPCRWVKKPVRRVRRQQEPSTMGQGQ
jgi:putative ABC transport system permease protein